MIDRSCPPEAFVIAYLHVKREEDYYDIKHNVPNACGLTSSSLGLALKIMGCKSDCGKPESNCS